MGKVVSDEEISRRIRDTFSAVRTSPRYSGGGTRLGNALRIASDKATFFYKWPTIPNWPPQLLLNKIVRKLLKPVLWPIAQFNVSACDAMKEMRDRMESLADEHRDAVSELERQIEDLQDTVRTLSDEVERLRSVGGRDESAG